MPDWLLPGIGIVVANVLVWAFVFGKTYGGLKTKVKGVENKLVNPDILPECREIFSGIEKGLAEVTGKVSAMFMMMTENQKNIEKKLSGRKKKQKD